MGKIKARKVTTPGSKPTQGLSPGRGRPKKISLRRGASRKGNYRSKYDPQTLKHAINAVKEKRMSMSEAARHYKIPKTTLSDRLHERVSESLGRPTVLSREEELIIVERLQMMGEWGYPMTVLDLRLLVKAYLDSQGRTSRFVNNFPGRFFVECFLRRHPTLTVRTANLIKRSRAALSVADVEDFFNRFEVTAADIPPENIYNYDETNLR